MAILNNDAYYDSFYCTNCHLLLKNDDLIMILESGQIKTACPRCKNS